MRTPSEAYLAGMDREAFERDGKTRDGRGSARPRIVWARVQPSSPQNQPWGDIRGMGNRRHAYDRLDIDIVWNPVRDRLPPPAADARRALAKLQRSTTS
jgi:uncharacterized protein with HEPN domain